MPVHVPAIPRHAPAQQRSRVGGTRHRRAAQERAPPALRTGGEGGLLGANLGGTHLPQAGNIPARCSGGINQGSGLEHIQAPRPGTKRDCRKSSRRVTQEICWDHMFGDLSPYKVFSQTSWPQLMHFLTLRRIRNCRHCRVQAGLPRCP